MKKLILLGAMVALSAGPAAAQVPGVDLILAPRAGLYMPLSSLVEESESPERQIKGGVAFGVSAELDLPASPINFRAGVDASFGRALEGPGATGKADVRSATVDIVFRPLPRLVVLQPYLLAGGGFKWYTFKDAPSDMEDRRDLTGHFGAGVDLKLGSIGLVAEVGDYISSFMSESGSKRLQNDVFLMAGLRVGLL
jgi:hypothetical protein